MNVIEKKNRMTKPKIYCLKRLIKLITLGETYIIYNI